MIVVNKQISTELFINFGLGVAGRHRFEICGHVVTYAARCPKMYTFHFQGRSMAQADAHKAVPRLCFVSAEDHSTVPDFLC